MSLYPKLEKVFDKSDQNFCHNVLCSLKPFESEKIGWVYIYQREQDVKNFEAGKLTHILLHKIGLTFKSPESRVALQEKANGEKYVILKTY